MKCFSHLEHHEEALRPKAGDFKELNDIQLRKVKKQRDKSVTVLPDEYVIE